MATYPQGWDEVIARYEARRAPLDYAPGEGLPPIDCDLEALARITVDMPGALAPRASGYARRRRLLAMELAGASELVLLHGVLISNLRKREWPDHAPALFRRVWAEQAPYLLDALSGRWLISAAITFADHGATESERNLGQSLKVFFSLLKLTEYERLFSGLGPTEPFRLGQKVKEPLPMGIEPFSIRDGGLDINMLAPIVQAARAEPVLGPLAIALLDRLNDDPGTIFRRIALMREKLEKRAAKGGKD